MKKHLFLSVLLTMRARKESLTALSMKAGLAPNYLSSQMKDFFNWNPRVDTLLNIAAALNIEPAALTRMSEELGSCISPTPPKKIEGKVDLDREVRNKEILALIDSIDKKERRKLRDFIRHARKDSRTNFLTLVDITEKTAITIEEILEKL